MSSIVFILGAGASKMAGVPLMNDFLDKSYDLWKFGWFKKYDEEFKLVYGAISDLQKVHSKSQLDIINIESVFSAFEMAKTLRQFSDYPIEKIDRLSHAMRTLIIQTIEQQVEFKRSQEGILPPKPYHKFAEMLDKLKSSASSKQSVSIITFNYDMCVDYALFWKHLPFDYGLRDSIESHHLGFFKLHGSLNWGYCEKCKKIIPFEVEKYCDKNGWHRQNGSFKMEIGSQLNHITCCDNTIGGEPVIVPPTWNKTDYHRKLSTVWSNAAKQLSEAEHIFIIGYSLPSSDEFFRYLYALGTVGNTTIKTFWVVNPDQSGTTQSKYRALLGPGAEQRFIYKDKRFDQIIEEIEKKFGI